MCLHDVATVVVLHAAVAATLASACDAVDCASTVVLSVPRWIASSLSAAKASRLYTPTKWGGKHRHPASVQYLYHVGLMIESSTLNALQLFSRNRAKSKNAETSCKALMPIPSET